MSGGRERGWSIWIWIFVLGGERREGGRCWIGLRLHCFVKRGTGRCTADWITQAVADREERGLLEEAIRCVLPYSRCHAWWAWLRGRTNAIFLPVSAAPLRPRLRTIGVECRAALCLPSRREAKVPQNAARRAFRTCAVRTAVTCPQQLHGWPSQSRHATPYNRCAGLPRALTRGAGTHAQRGPWHRERAAAPARA